MIISASRRTDIPAFYSDWFMNRVRAGYCRVANPRNSRQVARVSLEPENVDCIVFWSKNPAPLMVHLREIDMKLPNYYFLYTMNNYPMDIEAGVPPVEDRIRTFIALSRMIGSDRNVWRYDPILLSLKFDVKYHVNAFTTIARALEGATNTVIVSVVDFYLRASKRLADAAEKAGDQVITEPFDQEALTTLVLEIAKVASDCGMEIQSCAEDPRLGAMGIKAGKCIDDRRIREVFGVSISSTRDPGQRERCLCVRSRDIGANDSCAHGCEYCYATSSKGASVSRRRLHDPASDILIP